MNWPPVVAAVSAANYQRSGKEQATHLPLQRTRVGMISLGCAKNLVDAEVMLEAFCNAGWKSHRAPRTLMCLWLHLRIH